MAIQYYDEGIDEIIYMDVVASLYERNTLNHFIKKSANNIFVPITVGGGIRSLDDIRAVLNSGADKVAINTQALKNSNFIREASETIGSQSIVVSIEAKKHSKNEWEAYYDNGREKSGKDAILWAQEAETLGAGEILITSVDREGMQKGVDMELISEIQKKVTIPTIYCGGVGKLEDILNILQHSDAIALASILHYKKFSIKEIKNFLFKKNVKLRIN